MTNAALRTPALLLPWLLALVACGSDATSTTTPGDAPDAAFDAAADAAFDANAAVPDATAQEAGVRDASVSPGDSGTRDAGTDAARDAASDAARDAASNGVVHGITRVLLPPPAFSKVMAPASEAAKAAAAGIGSAMAGAIETTVAAQGKKP